MIKGRPILAAREVTFEPIESTDGMLSTVYNVDLCAVGIEYPLASGPATFTPEDLLQAVASQDDPAVQAPRVWLGHPDDDRFHAGRTSPVGSAEPALGKIINMRVEDEGMTLVGDVVGCPTWLARILSSAYPSRSIEGFQEAETVTGHKWGLVVTDLALLGVTWPGVSTLEDLQALYSEDGPEGIEVKEDKLAVKAARAIAAQVNVDDIRRAFYGELGDMDISSWSWIRAIQLDPNELIVDDDEGGLYRVAFEVKGDNVEFGEPAEVKIKYVNASQAKDPAARGLLVNMLTNGKTLAASYDQRVASRPANTQEESNMTPDQIRLLRARLGLSEEQLPDDATPEQITAALAEETPGDQPGTSPSAPPAPTTEPNPAGTPEVPTPDQQPEPVAAAALPEGMTAVPTEAWQQMQAQVQTLAAKDETGTKEQDKRLLAEAVRAGKVFPAQQQYYSQRLEDPSTRETFRHLLTASVEQGGLAPNLVPVTARGVDPGASDLTADAYPADWLPEVRSRDDNKITMEA